MLSAWQKIKAQLRGPDINALYLPYLLVIVFSFQYKECEVEDDGRKDATDH
jgi:hypothetical protein